MRLLLKRYPAWGAAPRDPAELARRRGMIDAVHRHNVAVMRGRGRLLRWVGVAVLAAMGVAVVAALVAEVAP